MTAITSLDNGTASLADLLGRARSPLAGTIDQLNRLAPLLDERQGPPGRQPSARARALSQARTRRRPTAPSSPTTSAGLRSAPATCRAAPCSSRGSDKIREGARNTNAEISRIQPHQGRRHRRRPDHPRHRRRACSRNGWCSTPPPCRYQALFSEAGGLTVGNDVTVSGIKVGTVSSIELDNGDALVGFTIDGKYALGSETTAHIRTGTLLGERVLALDSAGTGTLDPQQIIPTTRTSSPYSLTDAVSDLTANTAGNGHRLAQPVAGHAR